MKPPAVFAALAAALALGACATLTSPAASTQLAATQAFVVAEQGYDTAVVLADSAIRTGALPVATVSRIKALVDSGHTYVLAGRAAIAATDATTLSAQTAALAALAAQVTALLPGH